jgi:DNA-binding response OmpR family regulator
MLILFVEDNRDLAESVLEYLALDGFECDYAAEGHLALQLLLKNRYDAIVLDVNIPHVDGLTLCQQLRDAGIATPCLLLTARDSLDDKLRGFACGADDYLVKPFAMAELVVRLQALCRRHQHTHTLKIDDLVLDLATHQASRSGKVLTLSAKEWTLLLALARKSPEVLSREQLEDLLWPNGAPSKDALKMMLYRLRQEVDGNKDAQPLLQTLRGVGTALRVSMDK